MKKWATIVGAGVIIAGFSLWFASEMGLQYKNSTYVEKTIEKNMAYDNYEREFSLSLSFGESVKENEELSQLDNTLLVVNKIKDQDNSFLGYQFISQGEEFNGHETYLGDELVVKSPMYHRYITFENESFDNNRSFDELKNAFQKFLKTTASSITVKSNIAGNEERVKTLVVKDQNVATMKLLDELMIGLNKEIPFESILLNNEKITNRLLKVNETDNEVGSNLEEKLSAFKSQGQGILSDSLISSSEITLSIGEGGVIKSLSASIDIEYQNPETSEIIPFTVYFDMNTLNIGTAKVEAIQTDITNSLPYNKMTDEMNYFENENLDVEVNAEEDSQHIHKGYEENSTTLEEIGTFKHNKKDSESETKE